MGSTRVGVFLQARLSSTRLPQKVLLPLKGGNVLQHALRSLRKIKADVYALLTDHNSGGVLEQYAVEEGFSLFMGPEDDVLQRFTSAVHFFKVERVIRATGDNPLVSWQLASEILELHEKKRADLSHFINIPLGTGVEAVEASALLAAENESADPYEHEHITTFIYRHPERFTILEIEGPAGCILSGRRVTLDTDSDYKLIRNIFSDLYINQPIAAEDIVAWLKRKSAE